MSVESVERLQGLDAVLFDRPAGRNIVGHAVDTIHRLRAENAEKAARIVELEDALRMILIQDQFLHRGPHNESEYYYNAFDVDVLVNDALKGGEG